MNKSELYISRLQFKTLVYQSDGQSYEDLFVKVMTNSNPNFQPVKPQGRLGDKKNDGFDKEKGIYYQVYAPEDLREKINKAEEKLKEDFSGLKEYWTSEGFEIKEFYYVINDKYRGNYPTVIAAVEKIAQENSIKADIFRSKHLEDVFLSLSDDKIIDVVGWYPDPLDIQEVDYDVMSDIIKYLLTIETPVKPEKIPKDPNFEKKLVFNGLSKHICSYLNAGRFQYHAIKNYFEFNSEFTKDDLRQIFNSLYEDAIKSCSEVDSKNDEVFFYIVEKICPKKTTPYYTVIYILMAYYFEYCDIFETPNEEAKQQKLF